jgi:CRISPR/Cas system endoribonuclease Cas6 (RAMP superfamily)
MPRSAIIYTSREAYSELKEVLRETFERSTVKPYTISTAQKTESERVRVRVTELGQDAVLPILTGLSKKMNLLFASSADREVRRSGYEELIEDGERFETTAAIQFVSPAIVEVLHQPVPFPVLPVVMGRYIDVWNTFASARFPLLAGDLHTMNTSDFRISSVFTPFGVGGQGWITIDVGRGMTEEYIGLINSLVDFAFYSGTGLHTDEGFGQTRRMTGRVQTTK